MTRRPPPWQAGQRCYIYCCLRVMPLWQQVAPGSIQVPCALCGVSVWISPASSSPPQDAPAYYLCLQCFVEALPLDMQPCVLPANRAELDRLYGPRDWDQVARARLDQWRRSY
mgnify:CR=1 FL=1